VFGVQKIVNLACGSFYALGAYFGITFIGYAHQFGVSEWLVLPGLIISGLLLGFIGPPIERVLRTVYDRDESFQLLLTFALVLMFQDVFKFVWGANPRSLDSGYLIYGTISTGDFGVPVYNLLVIAAAIAVAAGLGHFLQRTNYGRILRATSIDELPQLWDVLIGRMSLVGPRPIVTAEIPKYGNKFDLYTKVTGGITGLWQISGRNDTSYDERVALYTFYVRNWSVWLDFYILFRTIDAVMFRKGAY